VKDLSALFRSTHYSFALFGLWVAASAAT